jgi:predicted DNA-binding transcriptional regulator AlpA
VSSRARLAGIGWHLSIFHFSGDHTMTASATTATKILSDFPHPHRLADMQTFCAVLSIAESTFHRYLSEKRLPAPIKVGRNNRWRETDIARVAAEGIPAIAA